MYRVPITYVRILVCYRFPPFECALLNSPAERVCAATTPHTAATLPTDRRVKKEDMRRIAKATGATIVTTLADMEGNETFDPEVLGDADEVRTRK